MISLRNASVGVALLALHACFVSTEPLIPEGSGAKLSEGPIEFCGDPEDACLPGSVEGDTYVIHPPEDAQGEAPLRLRFRTLTQSDLGSVWLGEAELREAEEGEAMWFYAVAHAMPPSDDGVTRFELVQPDCMQATLKQARQFGIEPMDSYTCSIGNIDSLAAYLIEAHGEDFNDPSWWSENR